MKRLKLFMFNKTRDMEIQRFNVIILVLDLTVCAVVDGCV